MKKVAKLSGLFSMSVFLSSCGGQNQANPPQDKFSKEHTAYYDAVFKELYRRYGNIYSQNIYYAADASSACDFVVYAEGGTPLPVQVCWSLGDPATRQRELRGLIKALRL